MREYVLGIAAAAMICGIILCFEENSPTKPLLKLICGLCLTFAMVQPFLNLWDRNWQALGIQFEEEAAEAVEAGKQQGEKTIHKLIKQETESYIMDKARELRLEIQAEVTLGDQALPVPERVTIYGVLPPYGKSRLSLILTRELGIAKENQRWIS